MAITSQWLFTGLVFCVLGCMNNPDLFADDPSGHPPRTASPSQPNIVLIIADDCTYRDLGCYGGQAYTPHIDQLATEGMLFTRCFQAAPMCSPTRHSLYTGLYPVKSGAYPNHTRVDEGTKSIIQYLRPLGYRIGQSGKLHVNPPSVFDWERLGTKKNPDFSAVSRFATECQSQGTPFCLVLCSNEPHSPWNLGDRSRYPADQVQLPPYFVDTPETRDGMSRYLAEVTYFDSQVGQAVTMVNELGIRDETLFIVLSEQGSSMPFAKWTCYDSGLQSGCVVRWPGVIDAASVNPAMIEYVDFVPTLIEAAGGAVDPSLDGKSLMPVLAGEQEHKTHVYGEMTTRGIINGSPHFGIRSIRSERYKLIVNFTPEVPFQNACVQSSEFQSWIAKAESGDTDAQQKVDRYQHRPATELYDIIKDPMEWNNLAGAPQLAEVQSDLRSRLDAWMVSCGDRGQETELLADQRMGRADRKRGDKKRRSKGRRHQSSSEASIGSTE